MTTAAGYRLFNASHRAISTLGARTRYRRMQEFCRLFGIGPQHSILDVGGRPEIWASIPEPLNITFLNLPGNLGADVSTHHHATFVEGDGCSMPQFSSRSFDIGFSNSVIEHVGPFKRQRAFAQEIRRIASAYWVQTPAIWFPIEAHTAMPLWWLYPQNVRDFFFDRWRRQWPEWTESMQDTRIVKLSTLQGLFAQSSLWIERLAGIPKSYAVYRTAS